MTVDQAYSWIKFLMRKNQTGSITPDEFAICFNSAQRDLFNTLLGKITIAPRIVLGHDERIAERLRPFKVTDEAKGVASQIATYPTDFQAITLMKDAATDTAVQYIDDTKLQGRLKSVIDPIAQANPPVFTNTSTGWKIWPATILNVHVSYYKLPTDVKWGFATNDTTHRVTYDETTSVQPMWDNVSCEEILAKCCTYLGISFEKQSAVQFGEAAKLQGV